MTSETSSKRLTVRLSEEHEALVTDFAAKYGISVNRAFRWLVHNIGAWEADVINGYVERPDSKQDTRNPGFHNFRAD